MFDLNGSRVVITGSSRGLGFQYASLLAKYGAKVVLHDISATAAATYGEHEDMEAAAASISAPGRSVRGFLADLTDPIQVADFAAKAIDYLGGIDVFVANAGGDIGSMDASGKERKPQPNGMLISLQDMRSVIDRNLLSCMISCRAFVPHMVASGRGKVITIASTSALIGAANETTYATAKAGVIHYTRCLAAELRPKGVTANCLVPGATRTARFEATLAARGEEDQRRFAANGRLERIAEPEDVAKVLAFLASPLSDFVSGQMLVVDGGATVQHYGGSGVA